MGVNFGYWSLLKNYEFNGVKITYPLFQKQASEVEKCIENFIFGNGVPEIIQSDNGKEFNNFLMKNLSAKWGFKIIRGRARYPQSQGQIERCNQTICRMLAKNMMGKNSKNWINLLREVT
jgi:transposase InsO family protein